MIYQESQRVRRIVGRLDRGEQLVDELKTFCREHDIEAADIRAVGRLSQVEVVRFDSESEEYEPVYSGEGDFDLLNLSGNIATMGNEIVVRLESVLSVNGPVGQQVITGQLRSGQAVEFEFVMEVFEDLAFERRMNRETGMLGLQSIKKEEVPEPTPEQSSADQPTSDETTTPEQTPEKAPTTDKSMGDNSIGGKSMSWDDAADASQEPSPTAGKSGGASGKAEDDDSDVYEGIDLDEPLMEAGDVLDHAKLGRCRVMKVEDEEYAHIRMPRGKIRKLSLNVLDVKFQGEEDGRNVFEARVNK